MTTIQEALQLLRLRAIEGSQRKLDDIKSKGAKAIGLQISEPVIASLSDIPDPAAVLRELAEESAVVKEAGTGIETGLDALSQGFGHLGLLDAELFPPGPDLRMYEVVGEEPSLPEITPPESAPSTRFYIDPETRAIIEGTLRGRLQRFQRGHALKIVQVLSGRGEPMTQHALTKAIVGKDADANLRSMRGKLYSLNQEMDDKGLPRIVERAEPSGYALSPAYALLDEQLFLDQPERSVQTVGEQRPTTYRIGEVSEELGMPVTRIRSLGYQLMESGHMLVGEHVMERHEGGKHYVDYTDTGKALFRRIGTHFKDYTHIPVDSVRAWLDGQPKHDVSQQKDEQQFYYGSHVAEAAGIPLTALETMHEVGVLQEGVHFVRRGERNIRVYTQAALPLAARVKARASKEQQHRFTERLVRDEFRIYEQPTENPFGQNGPKTVDDQVELFLLQTTLTCLPAMKRRGIEIGSEQESLLKLRMKSLSETIGYIEPEKLDAVRTRAAATMFDLTKNRRPFNFLEQKRPGLRIVGGVIDSLKAADPNLLVEFPNAVKEPPSPVPLQGHQGEVNGSILVGWMGDRR